MDAAEEGDVIVTSGCDKVSDKGTQGRAYPGLPLQVSSEAAGHIAFKARKQREEDAGAQLTFSSLLSPGPQLMEWCYPHSGWGFPDLLDLSGNTATSRNVSMVILSPISLTR